MSDKRPIVVLTGPTAVGKTELSIQLAKAINGEIISADSMQVYKKMDIGTAKIRPEEMMGVKHYLIDEFEPDEEFNVMKFKEYTDKYMNEIYEKGKIPILVGGTGFYIQAVLKDVEFKEEGPSDIRKELEEFANVHGPQALHERLAQIDPKSAEVIHQNNVRRVIRAIEFYEQTGMKFSEHNENEKQKQSPFNYVYFVLNQDRKILYDRIEKRIDIMMKDGLVEEVKSLISQGYGRDLVSMQGLGYKEIVAYLEGEITLEEAVYILKRDTRHFAKRQITWFKRETDVTWLDKDIYKTSEEQMAFCMEELKRKHIL